MNRGAWWSTVHEVAKSWTQLSDLEGELDNQHMMNDYTVIKFIEEGHFLLPLTFDANLTECTNTITQILRDRYIKEKIFRGCKLKQGVIFLNLFLTKILSNVVSDPTYILSGA